MSYQQAFYVGDIVTVYTNVWQLYATISISSVTKLGGLYILQANTTPPVGSFLVNSRFVATNLVISNNVFDSSASRGALVSSNAYVFNNTFTNLPDPAVLAYIDECFYQEGVVYSNITVTQNTFTGNMGAGMRNWQNGDVTLMTYTKPGGSCVANTNSYPLFYNVNVTSNVFTRTVGEPALDGNLISGGILSSNTVSGSQQAFSCSSCAAVVQAGNTCTPGAC